MSGPINPQGYLANTTITEVAAEAGVSPQPTASPLFPPGPEPSHVFGYLAFVDTGSGSEFIPHNPDNPLEVIAAPGMVMFRFMNPAGETMDLLLNSGYKLVGRGASGALAYSFGSPPFVSFAWYYDIQMNPDRSEGRPRQAAPVDFVMSDLRTGVFSYNPDQWRFVDVVGGPGIVGGVDYPGLPIPGVTQHRLVRRALPFPDLPDTV